MCGGKRKYKKRRCQCTVPPMLPARGRVLPFCQASDCHIVKSGSQIAWCLEALYDEYITIFVCRRAWLQLERPWRRNLKTELINVAVSGVVADKSVAYHFFLSATVRLSIQASSTFRRNNRKQSGPTCSSDCVVCRHGDYRLQVLLTTITQNSEVHVFLYNAHPSSTKKKHFLSAFLQKRRRNCCRLPPLFTL